MDPNVTGAAGETVVAFKASIMKGAGWGAGEISVETFEAKVPSTDGESREVASDARVFTAPADGGTREGAGET